MKKALTVMLAVVMLASIACISSSAGIRFTDTFDTWVEGGFWIGSSEDPQGDAHVISDINGNNVLEGFGEARVHQGHYNSNDDGTPGYLPGNGTVTTGTFWIDIYAEIERGEGDGAGLWWKNTYHEKFEGADKADAFTVKYHPGTSTFVFMRDYPEATTDEERIIAKYEDPRQLGENMASMKPVTVGFRVDPGKISAFADGKLIGSFEDPTIGTEPCPVLLWNDGLHVYWDNFNVGDLNELPLPGPNPGPDTNPDTSSDTNTNTNPPVTKVETKVVVVTDEDGETRTEIVSEIVTVPSADTNKGQQGNNGGAQTGDMVVVVAAMMVIALGSAIVVKKVSLK